MVTGHRWLIGFARRVFLLTLMATLGGCATGAKFTLASPDQDGIEALRSHEGKFRVGPVTSALSSSSGAGEAILAGLPSMLSVTLANFDYLQTDRNRPAYLITAVLEKAVAPFGGFNIKYEAAVRYVVTDPSGVRVLDKLVSSEGAANVSEKLIGWQRGYLGQERLYKNISRNFVEELNRLQVQ